MIRQSKKLLALFFALIQLSSTQAWAKNNFETEFPKSGWHPVREEVARVILDNLDPDDKVNLLNELKDRGYPTDFTDFFISRDIHLHKNKKEKFLFIRPAFEPYFPFFYGAHTFSYWVLQENQRKIIFKANSDKFEINKSITNGMRDVTVGQCRGGWCYNYKFRYDGSSYQNNECIARAIASPKYKKSC